MALYPGHISCHTSHVIRRTIVRLYATTYPHITHNHIST